MKSFLQFIEDAPVRTYNDPSVITSPNERARAGGREKSRGRQNRLDQQDARDSIRKEPTTSEKEAILGAGSTSGTIDPYGANGKKEDDRKPLNLRPKRIPAHEALKNSYLEKLSEKEGFIPERIRASLDSMTDDRDAGDELKKSIFRSANKVMDSISGKHPFMDTLSGAISTIEEPTGYQKRLQSIKEMIDKDDDGDVDEDLHLLIKQRLGLKGKSASFVEKLENEGLNPYEFMDTSKSAELSSDLNIEDFDADGSDFIPKYGRQISKSLKGIPNHVAGDFLDSLDRAQRMYKNDSDDGIDFDAMRKLFQVNDELDETDDREYEGLNTYWNLSPESFEDNGVTPLDGVDRDSTLEVAWNNLLNPANLNKLKKTIEKGEGNIEEKLEEMLGNGEQRHQQKIMSIVNDYAEKSGSSIRDILGTEDGVTGLQDYIKLMTVLDAKRTWKDQIFPDLEDGEVLRNMPMGGGRDGNARERIYKQVGFGELLGDDYQYGQKVEGEKKLKPLDDTNIEVFDEDKLRVDTYEAIDNMLTDYSDLPFDSGDFLDYVQNELDWRDREDLYSISQDPEDFFEMMQERMIDRQLENTYFAPELNDVLEDGDGNPIADFYQELEDKGIELSEFTDHLESYVSNLDYEDQVEMLRSIQSRNYDEIRGLAAKIVADYKEENEWEEEAPDTYFANKLSDVLDDGDENPIKDLYKELEDEGMSVNEFNKFLQDEMENLDSEERDQIDKLIQSRDYDRIETMMINIVGRYKKYIKRIKRKNQ